MEPIIKWIYGGQDRSFFSEHREQIHSHNMKSIALLDVIMTVVTAVYFVFDLNSVEWAMRLSYLWYFLLFVGVHATDRLWGRKHLENDALFFALLAESVFSFLLVVGPIYDPGNLACFIPVFLVVMPLLCIVPMSLLLGLEVLDCAIFAVTTLLCKEHSTAVFDIVDAVTCAVIGLTLGRSILGGRLSEIEAYALLKKRSENEINRAMELANRDPLTGVKSRAAYESMESELNKQIADGIMQPFAIVMCDLNWLKEINDREGHEAGDRIIMECSRTICTIFAHSPVYRVGGDEFVVLLRNSDYENRAGLMEKLRSFPTGTSMEKPYACGISEYRPGEDHGVHDVFIRADAEMYENKKILKGL